MSPGVRYVLLLHAAIAGLYIAWRLSAWWEGATRRRAGARRWASLGKVFLLAALAAPLLCAGLERAPTTRRLLPAAPLAGAILGEADGPGETTPAVGAAAAPAPLSARQALARHGQTALLAAWTLGALGIVFFRARQWRRVRGLLAEAVPVRRVGWIEILVHPAPLSPFATRVRGRATVVVPSFLVENGRWREAVRHELQHHRQGDPRWTVVWDVLTALMWINPAIWCWRRAVLSLQEMACDERLLEKGGVSPAAYGETLLDVAEALSRRRAVRAASSCPSLARRGSRAQLAARLERILDPSLLRRSSMIPRAAWILVGAGLCAGMAGAWAASGATDSASPNLRLRPELQKLAEDKLSAHLQRVAARGGVVVAMDPATGAVLARAGFRRHAVSGRLVADESAPLTQKFPAASTIKTLVVAGALEARVVDASETFDTGNGVLTVDGRTYREWKDGGLGKVSPADVLVKSSNLGAIQIARRLGVERLTDFLNHLGVAVAKDARVAELSYGDLSGAAVTAHQLAYAYSALVNGGRDPRTGAAIVRPEVSSFIRAALAKAVEDGTGVQAHCRGFAAGGKTGTSTREINNARTGTALFVGFAPADNPRIVVSIIVDDVGPDVNGNRHAASLFPAIVENGLPLLEKTASGKP